MLQNAIALSFFFLANASSPSTFSAATPPGCGDPATVDQAYPENEGVVVEIPDAVTLIVDTRQPAKSAFLSHCSDKNCLVTVRLVNLDLPSDSVAAAAGKQALAAMLQSKHVHWMISPVQNEAGVTNGIVYLDERDINEQQLASGYATYRSFGPYAIDGYLECRFLSAYTQARLATPRS